MGSVIGIIAIKGGVGKTTLSASLASDLVNNYGKKVLLIDANYSAPNLGLHMDIVKPNGTIHEVLAGRAKIQSAIHSRYGVDVIPGSYFYDRMINTLKLRDKIARLKNNYDFVIIDSSPSLNEEILSTILASDSLFLVTTPDYPTLSSSIRVAKLVKQRGRNISGIIINKIRDPKYELNLEEIEEALDIPVVAKIPDDAKNIGALFSRIPTVIYDKKGKFSKEINNLSAALTCEKEKIPFFRRVISSHFRKEEMNRQILKKDFYDSVFK
ncbi:MAG: AAA family ATPase [Nanoarchaeota archaeon]